MKITKRTQSNLCGSYSNAMASRIFGVFFALKKNPKLPASLARTPGFPPPPLQRTAAVSGAAPDQPQHVGSSIRVEYFGPGHSREAAATGLRHSRGPGAGPAAGRHAIFVRATVGKSSRLMRACKSAVAAGALPAQSMTRTELPGASKLRGASWSAVTCHRFGTGRHVAQCQSANMFAHSKKNGVARYGCPALGTNGS
jgi:hypothetical protein